METMQDDQSKPPLKALHSSGILSQQKLEKFRRVETPDLVESLRVDLPGSLKTRPDGTILDGHHRIAVLRERKVDVDGLPREVLQKHDCINES
jgi:hypothetical protein